MDVYVSAMIYFKYIENKLEFEQKLLELLVSSCNETLKANKLLQPDLYNNIGFLYKNPLSNNRLILVKKFLNEKGEIETKCTLAFPTLSKKQIELDAKNVPLDCNTYIEYLHKIYQQNIN
jgi:hypothetical protein